VILSEGTTLALGEEFARGAAAVMSPLRRAFLLAVPASTNS
jgi:hypothetical protein